MKTLVLGLGNPILTDDGVGIHVVRAAAARCQQEGVPPLPTLGEGAGVRASPPLPTLGEGAGVRASPPLPALGEGAGVRATSPPPTLGEGADRRSVGVGAVVFAEASVGGLRLLDCLAGYERVIMVDAIQTGDGVEEYIRKPGDIYRLHPSDLRASLHAGSTHDLSLPGALALGRRLGIQLPDNEAIVIIAVEVEDVLTFGEACTPAVAAAIPRVVEVVLAELAAGEGE